MCYFCCDCIVVLSGVLGCSALAESRQERLPIEHNRRYTHYCKICLA